MENFTFNRKVLDYAPAFDFNQAQIHELSYHVRYIKNHFPDEWEALERRKLTGDIDFDVNDYFEGNQEQFEIFLNHIEGKKSLEIGCGCIPDTKEFYKVKDRIVLDPLADNYKKVEEMYFNRSFFEGYTIYNQKAEERIDELVGKVDGMIYFQNALDHTDDPLSILDNVSEYAMPGCYLIFFSDIWHIIPPNAGHRSITRSVPIMDKLFRGMGFRKVFTRKPIRDASKWIEYGAVFIKE